MLCGPVQFNSISPLLFGLYIASMQQQPAEREFKGPSNKEKHMPILESGKEEPGWPSFGQLIVDLSKLSLEVLASAFTQFIPSHFRPGNFKRGLMPLKDHLVMPEDQVQPPLGNRQNSQGHNNPVTENRLQSHINTPLAENRMASHVHAPSTAEKYSEMKPPKIKSSSFKDPSLSSKHRSSKRPEYAEFYGSTEFPPYTKSKSQKERPRHRQREKSGEVVMGAVEAKPVETRAVDHNNPKFDHYSMRTKYASEETYRFNSQ